MTEPRDDHELADRTSTALHDLHGVIRERVQVPPSAEVRRRAERAERLRYTGVVAATVAVLLVLLVAWQLPKHPTRPDAVTSPGPSPLPAATFPPPPPVTDDSIKKVNFDDRTVVLAPNPDVPSCPAGPVHIVMVSGKGADGRVINTFNIPDRVFGDVDRDGRLDALEVAGCYPPGQDETAQWLVVSRRADGTLTGRWTGPVEGASDGLASISPYVNFWVADGLVYADIRSPHSGPDFVLGQLHAFAWTGNGLTEVQQNRYPALMPTRDKAAPPVRLGPLGAALGCPGGTTRFNAEGTATVDGARYDTIMPPAPAPFRQSGPDPAQLYSLRQWVDLGGRRLLIARINCTRPDGGSGGAIAVLVPDGTGLTVLDAVRIDGKADTAWDYDRGNGDTLTVIVRAAKPRDSVVTEWTWDGSHFHRSR
jgi:hypothetical protein